MKSPIGNGVCRKVNGTACQVKATNGAHSNNYHQSSISSTSTAGATASASASSARGAGPKLTNNHQYNQSSNNHLNHQHHHNNSDYSGNSVCDTMNGGSGGGSKEVTNGTMDVANGSQGSPLRSQLGLKLKKSNAPASLKKSPNLAQVCMKQILPWWTFDI